MRIIFAVLATVALVTAAEANHIAGHYGGVPAVQPAPLPWRSTPPAQFQPYVAPSPVYVPPQQPVYVPVPVPAPVDESPRIPARRRAPNVCDAGC